jgi:hypothetical protein
MSKLQAVGVGILIAVVIVVGSFNLGFRARITEANDAISALSNRCDAVESNVQFKADARAVGAALHAKADAAETGKALHAHNIRLSVTELATKKEVGDKQWSKHIIEVAEIIRKREADRKQAFMEEMAKRMEQQRVQNAGVKLKDAPKPAAKPAVKEIKDGK